MEKDKTAKDIKDTKADIKKLQQLIVSLSRRIQVLERENRSLKAKAHQLSLDVSYIKIRTRGD